jgi:hypothetical protein
MPLKKCGGLCLFYNPSPTKKKKKYDRSVYCYDTCIIDDIKQ